MSVPSTRHDAREIRLAPMPGLFWGPYPERVEREGYRAPKRASRGQFMGAHRLASVRSHLDLFEGQDDSILDDHRRQLQAEMSRDGLEAGHLEQAVAFAAEAARRTLGQRAYDGQLWAALLLLDQHLVEMSTGEGKSFTTALAAAAGALAGMPVHVLTANDYLVQRDADGFRAVFERLGLQVASVVSGMALDERRTAYARPVVYVTARELVFDYLRDRATFHVHRPALQQRAASLATQAPAPLLRGLCMGLVDEADSVLIDEAQLPLILSRARQDAMERAYRWQAWQLSDGLSHGSDFVYQPSLRQVVLTEAGRQRLAAMAPVAPLWQSSRHRDLAVNAALVARYLLVRDRDYVVRRETDASGQLHARVVIVDSISGRLAEGRRWSRGLHAMVAIKEGCTPEPDLETISQITYQGFFRRYHRLGGLSGTLREARAELLTLYGLPVAAVPPRLPLRRDVWPTRLYSSALERWAAVRDRCAELSAQGRPVLVGTESVADSQALSNFLTAAGLPHAVLNALHDASEAAIVAQAGKSGHITVATNMAGRGTDISLDPHACAAGGLHVLSCQLNASRRLDRQLGGRAARQGQPGSTETWISLDAPRFNADRAGRLARWLITRLSWPSPLGHTRGWRAGWHSGCLQLCLRALQFYDERREARARVALFRQDCAAERGLSFSDGA